MTWVMTVPVLSTCHLPSPEAYDWLAADKSGCANLETCFVWVDAEEEDPKWWKSIVEYIFRVYPKSLWVRFDRDGDVIPELKQYEW